MRPSHNCHCTCPALCMVTLAFYTSTTLCISALYTINKLAKVILILFRTRGWSHWKYMNLILCCLIYSLLFMLYQCIPCWRNIVNTLDIIYVELLLTIIDIFHCWGPVIHKACKPLNDLHTIFVWTEAVAWFWISYKHHCYFIKYLPCSPCFQLVFSTKGRNSVTSCEHIPEKQSTTSFSLSSS